MLALRLDLFVGFDLILVMCMMVVYGGVVVLGFCFLVCFALKLLLVMCFVLISLVVLH